MTIAHVVSVTAQQDTNNNATSAAVDTTSATLIIIAAASQSSGLTGFQSDVFGNYYTPLTYQGNANNGVQLLYCVKPRCGPGHVFTSYGHINTRLGFVASAFSGVALWDAYTRQETGAGVNGLGSVAVPTLTPPKNNCLVAVVSSHQNTSGTPSIDGGFSLAANVNSRSLPVIGYGAALFYLVQTTAAAAAPTVTFSAATWGSVRSAVFTEVPYIFLSNSASRLVASAPNYSVKQMFSTVGARNAARHSGRLMGTRNYGSGSYHIAGFTTCDEEYVARDVYLMYHPFSGTHPLRRTNPMDVIDVQRTANGIGSFDFTYLQPGNYTVISVDPAGLEDDVIRTNIAAVAM